MVNIEQQIESHRLVCPVTHRALVARGGCLETRDGKRRYPLVGSVPILLADATEHGRYFKQDFTGAAREHSESSAKLGRSLFRRVKSLGSDYRSQPSRHAFHKTVAEQPPEALCISVGGGPSRAHPNLVNLNIELFPNVDVIADAHTLPYAADSVDAIYCEAVLEHLEFPDKAVAEMWRVLKPAGQVFAATPFLQRYHADPGHFQNFTLKGHRRLFERAGFSILSSGPCVGPTVALSDLMIVYARHYTPKPLKFLSVAIGLLVALPLRPLDLLINRTSVAHKLASTTYVHAVKACE